MKQAEITKWDFVKDFKTEDGIFYLYDKGIGFESPIKQDINDEIEYFSFCEGEKSFRRVNDGYISIKKDFIDYKVLIVGNKIFILFLYPNKVIKPIKINGHYCGDIKATKLTANDFHHSCGHAIISSKKIESIKDFREEMEEYKFKSFSL